MDRVFNFLNRRAMLVAAVSCLVLAGCGGGGDGGGGTGTGTNPTAAVQILDSFGQVVVAGGADGVGPGDSGGDGTAGDGAAIVGGVVVLTDSTGKSVSATTDALGYYRAKLTGFTPPLVAKVTKPDGKVLHSLSVKTLKVNGFITVNITGLTDKVASDVARAGGKNGAADLTPQIVSSNVAVINQSVSGLGAAISTALAAAGVDANSFDPLAAPFRPDHTGYDFVLDHVVVVVAADGSTQVTVSPSLAPALAGNWRLSVISDGITIDTGVVAAGKDVPTAQNVSQMVPANFSTALTAAVAGTQAGQTTPFGAFTISVNGTTITVTGPGTNYSINIINFSVSNYQSCGACGVGSQVSFVLNATITDGGVLNGFQVPTTTESGSATVQWVRVN